MNRLGDDVLELCPSMKDKEDENEIQQNFCFVLADEQDTDGIISYHTKQLLQLSDLVLPIFSTPNSSACLMLHVMDQEHGLATVDTIITGTTHKLGEEAAAGAVSSDWKKKCCDTQTSAERPIWRQQDTVIFYDGDNYMEHTDLETEEKSFTENASNFMDTESSNTGSDIPSESYLICLLLQELCSFLMCVCCCRDIH